MTKILLSIFNLHSSEGDRIMKQITSVKIQAYSGRLNVTQVQT